MVGDLTSLRSPQLIWRRSLLKYNCSISSKMAVKCQVIVKILQLYLQNRDMSEGKLILSWSSTLALYTRCKTLCISGASGFYETARQTRPLFTHTNKRAVYGSPLLPPPASLQLLQLGTQPIFYLMTDLKALLSLSFIHLCSFGVLCIRVYSVGDCVPPTTYQNGEHCCK